MRDFFQSAIKNIYRHGDTDIYPFPIENRILFDKIDEFSSILEEVYNDFDQQFAQNAPDDIRALVAASHSGFRWGAQLDPLWNAFLLGAVLSIAERIEDTRLPPDQVYSYRLDRENYREGTLFSKDVNWRTFIDDSLVRAAGCAFVVTCDVADCYSRISHHKLDNNLRLIDTDPRTRKGILSYLQNFTGTRSAGLPVGGPAARILSELALNNTDQLMAAAGVKFARYADDYHIFCRTRSEAHDLIVQLYRWLDNDGLTLQKSKTRILTSAEFRSMLEPATSEEPDTRSPIQRLMSLTLRFDPYAPDAAEQYEALKDELEGIDLVGLLNEQLSQTRVHIPTARKIVETLKFSGKDVKAGAVIAMLDNIDALAPIAPTTLQSIASIFDDLDDDKRSAVSSKLIDMYDSDHEIFSLEINIAYMNRVLAKQKSLSTQHFLARCFDKENSDLVRRDIVLIFGNWGNFPWLSFYKGNFLSLSGWQRRALILASYSMADEGKHWRDHTKGRFDKLEMLVRDWKSERSNQMLAI